MLKTLHLVPLEERRGSNRLTLMYEIINENVAVLMEELDLRWNPRATRGQTTQDKLLINRCITDELNILSQPELHQNGIGLQNLSPQLTQYPHLRVSQYLYQVAAVLALSVLVN